MPKRQETVRAWLTWWLLFAMSVGVLLPNRLGLRIANSVVIFLLLVLGGSLAGGRTLGFSLVAASYVAISVFFLPPYGKLHFGQDSDWLILVGLAGVGLTTTELLTRFRRQAEIAEDRLAEIELLAAERERLSHEVSRTETLRDAERLKNALLASVTHDLRTPLATIAMLAQQGSDRGDDASTRIGTEAARLTGYVNTLADWARTVDGQIALKAEFNTAEDLIGAALRAAQSALRLHPVTVRIQDEATDVLAGIFDFPLALRALVNVIENAAKYTPHETPIEVVAERWDGRLAIAVRDRGPGVPDGDEEKIFTPFFRAASTRGRSGAGLGLAIAREFMRAQGGDIRYAPREGGGAVFQLTMPIATLPTNTPELPAPVSAPVATTASVTSRGLVQSVALP